jgi:hypothetical protein
LTTANVQHRCAEHLCQTSGSTFIQQERHVTTLTKPALSHKNPGDLILNTARMRDSALFTQFRKSDFFNAMDMETSILQGATNEINMRKATQTESMSGRGRGQQRAHAGRARVRSAQTSTRGRGAGHGANLLEDSEAV